MGERIKHFRKQKRMTLEQLSDGISTSSYLSQIENGMKTPNQEYTERIADKLGISTNLLVKELDDDPVKRIKEIAARYKREKVLCEDDKAFLILHSNKTYSPDVLYLLFGVLISHFSNNRLLQEAEEYLNRSKLLLPEIIIPEHKNEQIYYYLSSGNFFYQKQDFFNADKYYTKAEQLLSNDNELDRAIVFRNLSLTKQRLLSDKRISLYYSDRAYELYTILGEEEKAHEVLLIKAIQLHLLGKYDESITHLKKAWEYFDQQNNLLMLGMIETNLGRVYQGKKEYALAIEHLDRSLEIKNQIGDEKGKVYIYRSLIQIDLDTRKLDSIEDYLKKALSITEKLELSYLECELHELKACLYLLTNDKQHYIKEMARIIGVCKEKDHIALVKSFSHKFASFLYEERQYKKAADYYKEALEIDLGEGGMV